MSNNGIVAELKNNILNVEEKLNGYFREDFDEIYNLIEQLEESINKPCLPYQNITEDSFDGKKNKSDNLKVSEEQLRIVVRNANVLIFIIDKNGIITLSEGKALMLFKFLPNQITGISIFDIYDDKPEIKEEINRALQGTTTSSILEIQDYIFETIFSPYRDSQGNVDGIVAIAVNVTERVKMQEEREKLIDDLKLSSTKILQDANRLMKLNDKLIDSEERLRTMNDEKDKFISIISHDLRSPFSGILGIVDGIVAYFDKYSKKELKNALEMLGKTSHHLFDLLENLLLWARTNRGKMEVNKESIPLYVIVKANIELLINNAIPKKISIINNTQKNIYVVADENMLNTVLRNLISNAVKFTKPGGEIVVSSHKSLEDNRIEIWVCDNGVGMPTNVAENIFNLNRQYTSLGTNNERGTGLGLFICKEMVLQNNGKIWVESELNKGSSFKIEMDCLENDNIIDDDELSTITETEEIPEKIFNISYTDIALMDTAKLGSLLNELQEKYLPLCIDLLEMQILGSIAEFAVNLTMVAEEYECNNLSRYAEMLLEKVKLMDVVLMNKYLEYFPELVNNMKQYKQTLN